MRYLILSDIHANWTALEAVVQHAEARWDRILCCGDVVGYGPDPNRVAEWTRQNAAITIRGNHDKVCCGLEDLEWFNEVAQESARWTMGELTSENLQWLRALPRGPVLQESFQLVHGSPLDEDEYVSNIYEASNVFDYVETELTFFGHTHLQGGFFWRTGSRSVLPDLRFRIEPEAAYLVNPGSVGQPRDADPRASYALYDSDSGVVELRRAAYDHESVAARIEAAGLPSVLGSRLAIGR